MKLMIKHQERYSRGELLLRTLFGWLYIVLPHAFLLGFVGIWGAILSFVAFWVVLFTGKYPQSMFEFQVGMMKWGNRLQARVSNLVDGYPPFGVKASEEYTDLQVPYPEKISRGLVLLRVLFGAIYVYLPHGFILMFRQMFVGILVFFSWWIVLFTGEYPKSFHDWAVGQIRWSNRIALYMGFMTDKYPPFTGDELPEEV